MERIRTIDMPVHVGKQVQFNGWSHNVRKLGSVQFLVLRDGWGTIQAVSEDETAFAVLEKGLANGTVIRLTGTVVASEMAAAGYELHAPTVTVITPVADAPPLARSAHTQGVAADPARPCDCRQSPSTTPSNLSSLAGAMAGFGQHWMRCSSPRCKHRKS